MTIPNPLIQRHSSKQPEWTEGEIPAHLSVSADLKIGSSSFSSGDLLVTCRRVVFIPTAVDQNSIGFEYPSMVMHAITTDECSGRKCIFVQLQTGEDEEELDETQASELVPESIDDVLTIFPTDETVVNQLFEAMNEMSALNPDKHEQEADVDGEDYEAFEDEL